MELSLTDRLTRAERPVWAEGKKSADTAAISSKEQTRTDHVSLSKQAVAYLEEQRRLSMERFAQETARKAREETEGKSAEESQLEALTKSLKAVMKSHEIAARIMRGDKVPPEDERYLMENDPDGYKLAMAMRTPKKHPKEWESILDDEDKNGGSKGTGETREAAASSEGASSGTAGGGEAGGGE